MKTQTFDLNGALATYLISNDVLIRTEQDALDIMGEAGTGSIILHDHNFEKDFFDLSTKKLGDVFQKFSNYRVRLAIIGYFSKYPSKTLVEFIRESNRHTHYIFVSSLEDVQQIWG